MRWSKLSRGLPGWNVCPIRCCWVAGTCSDQRKGVFRETLQYLQEGYWEDGALQWGAQWEKKRQLCGGAEAGAQFPQRSQSVSALGLVPEGRRASDTCGDSPYSPCYVWLFMQRVVLWAMRSLGASASPSTCSPPWPAARGAASCKEGPQCTHHGLPHPQPQGEPFKLQSGD